jgi:hypothetical protein
MQYSEKTAVLGPLEAAHEPGSYDLCSTHADSFKTPVGWSLRRVSGPQRPVFAQDELLALADAVRRAGRVSTKQPVLRTQRGHLGVVAD